MKIEDIKDMSEAIFDYCNNHDNDCLNCPLFGLTGTCYSLESHDGVDYMQAIPRNYEILVSNGFISKHKKTDESANDPVNHPSHYTQGGIECIDAMILTQGKEAVMSFCLCNAFKYLWRHNHKEETSIDKALWYLSKYCELRDMKNADNQTV